VQITQHLQMPNLSPHTFTANVWRNMQLSWNPYLTKAKLPGASRHPNFHPRTAAVITVLVFDFVTGVLSIVQEQIPTNDVKTRFSNNNSPTCRNCHSDTDTETLPHIICHCIPNMPSITSRHDQILKRLTNTIHRGSYTVDQTVPGAPGNNRPI
jgi:hypothetical protein